MSLLFREEMESRTVMIEHLPLAQLPARVRQRSGKSACHCLLLSVKGIELRCDEVVVSELSVAGPAPSVKTGRDTAAALEAEEPFEVWTQALIRLLQMWI